MSGTDPADSDPAASVSPCVVEALEGYLAALEAGRPPDRHEFLARHADVRAALAECLDGLELLRASGAARAAADLQPGAGAPEPLGDFRILHEIGRGGMGVVYEAEQVSLGRRVALKVLPVAAGLDPRQLQRFRNEAQAAAQLQHPHIVPVYAVGCERGVHYYAMQLIDGRTVAALIRRRRARQDKAGKVPSAEDRDWFRTAARLGAQAAEALECAHQVGVVHRDVKPANLLVDGRGDAWVADFGLAQFRDHPGLTLSGDLVGTLRYMAPEQALAPRGLADHRADIYALGATLYELLTLRHAVPGSDRAEVLRRLAFADPPAPRRLNPAVPRDLETVVLKAIAKDPAERYASAAELAADLRRFLDDRPVRARRPSLPQRARQWARRHRTLVASLAISTLLLAAGLSVAALLHARQRDAILCQRLIEGAHAQRLARVPGYRATVWRDLHEAARLAPAKHDAIRDAVLDCLGDPLGLSPKEREEAAGIPRRPVVTLPGWLEPRMPSVGSIGYALTADGKFGAVTDNGAVSLRHPNGREVAVAPAVLGAVRDLAFAPDGRLLLGACDEGVVVWDVPCRLVAGACDDGAAAGAVPRLAVRWRMRGGVTLSVAVDPAGELLATSGRQVELWSLVSWRQLASFPAGDVYGLNLEFSADGQHLLAVTRECDPHGRNPAATAPGPMQAVRAWVVRGTPERQSLPGHDGGVPAVAFSPDGRTLASVSKDQTLRLWDPATGVLRQLCRRHEAAIEAVAFSPDGKLVATGDFAGAVRIWDAATGEVLARVADGPGGPGQVWRLLFTPDGRLLVAAGACGLSAWAVRPAGGAVALDPVAAPRTPTLYDVAVHPGGSAVLALGKQGMLLDCRLGPGGGVRVLPLRAATELRSLHFEPDGRHFIFVTDRGKIGTAAWPDGFPARVTDQPTFQLDVSPDGRWAATSTPERRVVVYDLRAERPVWTLPAEVCDVWSLAWSPDGTRLAVSLSDGGLAIWNLEEVRTRLAEFGIDVPSTRVQQPLPPPE